VEGIEPPPHGPKPRMIPFHHTEKTLEAGEGFAPPMLRAYETGLLATLPAKKLVPQEGIEPPHPAYKTGPLPLRIQGLYWLRI
jgi:hypothetical protein